MGKKISNDEFIEKANNVHCQKYGYEKVVYKNNKTKVIVSCPIHGDFLITPHAHIVLKQGCRKCFNNKCKKYICGVGVNDIDCISSEKSYIVWKNMIKRCYDLKVQEKQRTYIGCSVCDDWLIYSNFKKWFDCNYIDGWHLDKDLIIKGNKVYSPDTCCFVPRILNNTNKRYYYNKKKLPIGVRLNKNNLFFSEIKYNGKSEYLGSFNSIEEAFFKYKVRKEQILSELAEKYKNKISIQANNSLKNYKVEITD